MERERMTIGSGSGGRQSWERETSLLLAGCDVRSGGSTWGDRGDRREHETQLPRSVGRIGALS